MAEIINLRRVRKARVRAGAQAEAAANRAKSGMNKAGRKRAEDESERADRQLDGHKLRSPEQV